MAILLKKYGNFPLVWGFFTTFKGRQKCDRRTLFLPCSLLPKAGK